MSCVLEILSYEELFTRKSNLLKQLEKVNDEILEREKSNKLSNKINKIKIKVNIVKKK
jgi:hypothetical protein